MCGRYGLTIAQDELALALEIERSSVRWEPRYNIAPTQNAPVLRLEDGHRTLDALRWGLVPFWADNPKIGNRMINARSETVASKPAFRAAFRRRRCLVPVSGFFEWAKDPGGKRPHWIHSADDAPLTFAGLWERWEGEGGHALESFTILTTRANELIAPIHDRMPVIVPPDRRDLWMDPDSEVEALPVLFEPRPGVELDLYEVDTRVNRPANEGPECIEPLRR